MKFKPRDALIDTHDTPQVLALVDICGATPGKGPAIDPRDLTSQIARRLNSRGHFVLLR